MNFLFFFFFERKNNDNDNKHEFFFFSRAGQQQQRRGRVGSWAPAGVCRSSRRNNRGCGSALPFFFWFSSLEVKTEGGAGLGRVERRFGLIYKKYDLVDVNGRTFAKVSSPLWRLWTFPVRHTSGVGAAEISKKWGGALREIFADADTFRVAIEEGNWSGPERWVLFAAAISIDFDFFENNQGSGGLFSFFD